MNINALVIEDERADVVIIRQALAITSAGSSHVEYRTSLAEGVERLTHGGIDVVLLDLSLPDSDGNDTLMALHCAAPQVPLLVVAGAVRGTVDRRAVDLPRHFILKDHVDCHRLGHIVRSVILRKPFADTMAGWRLVEPSTPCRSTNSSQADPMPGMPTQPISARWGQLSG